MPNPKAVEIGYIPDAIVDIPCTVLVLLEGTEEGILDTITPSECIPVP